MGDYVLSVWTAGQEPVGGVGIRLRRNGEDAPLAEHPSGFDMAPFRAGGAFRDPEDSLTAAGLLDDARTAAVGDALWACLTPGTVGDALAPLLLTERIYLDLRSDDLMRLPWELLRYADTHIFTHASARWSLGRPEQNRVFPAGLPPETEHPLRVLVVLGNDPGDARIRAKEELEVIEHQAHLVNAEVLLTVLAHPDATRIEDTLKAFRPHVFHFIGHGSSCSGEDPQVYAYASDRVSSAWDAKRIRAVFAQAPPRLVVLNACQTAHAPTRASSLIQAFTAAGCIATVAMMGDIEGEASVAFSERFYREIFRGATVDAAATSARLAIGAIYKGRNDETKQVQSNWPLPRLTVRGDAEAAVTMPYANHRAADRWLTPDFVARWGERWRAWRAMDGSQQLDGAEARLAVLWGEKDRGKRELLNTLAEARARAGDTVIDVNLAGGRTGRWRDVLRRIAEAAETSGHDATALSEAAGAPGLSTSVIERFRSDLERLRDDGPVLVVLDGLSDWIADELSDTVLPELCAPYLRCAPGSGVRMMISLRNLPGPAVWGRRPERWEPVEIGRFDDEEWPRAMAEFCEYWFVKAPDQRQAIEDFARLAVRHPFASSLTYLRMTATEKL